MRTLLSILCLAFYLANPAQAALSVQAEDAVKQFLDQHPSLERQEFSFQRDAPIL